jgi:hypothetical protein
VQRRRYRAFSAAREPANQNKLHRFPPSSNTAVNADLRQSALASARYLGCWGLLQCRHIALL